MTAVPLPLMNAPAIAPGFCATAKIILHEGDAFSFVRRLPSEIAQLIITSPPYNIGKEYENRTSIQRYLSSQEKPLMSWLEC